MAATETEALFLCDQCNWSGKTKGALTNHKKKEHSTAKLDTLRSEMQKMGVPAPMPGGAVGERKLKATPSGVPSVDYVMGIGGIPQGSVIEIFGPPRAGKTFMALVFAAFAQQRGGRAGFTDAERALTSTFLDLIPGLDVDALEYGESLNGEHALNTVKKFAGSGLFNVWVLDSLHACVPQKQIDMDIGDSRASAALAQLLSQALPVIVNVIANTPCSVILINHEKEKPNQMFGSPLYTPGGSAPEYYSAMRLRVSFGERYELAGSGGKAMGHRVRVKLRKSKVGPPGATAEYDIYYHAGKRKDNGRHYETGIDIGSCWLSVLKDEELVTITGSKDVIDLETGEKLGNEYDVIEALQDDEHPLVQKAHRIVYPDEFS